MKQHLAKLLSVPYDTINRWLSRIDKDEREERDAAVQDLWLQCYTAEEISEAVGVNQETAEKLFSKIRNYEIAGIPGMFSEDLPDDSAPEKKKREAVRAAKIIEHNRGNAEHDADFEVPIYNVWKQQTKSDESSHFGEPCDSRYRTRPLNLRMAWPDALSWEYLGGRTDNFGMRQTL